MSTAEDSKDQILICRSMSDTGCAVIHSNTMPLRFKSSKSYIMFKTGSQISLETRGWELRYSVGKLIKSCFRLSVSLHDNIVEVTWKII